jgi:hypothetical protein
MTEIRISVDEFNDYEIEAEDGCVDLALPMREFKVRKLHSQPLTSQATLQLAEQLNMDLDFFFSEATQPLAMSSRFHGLDRDNNEKQLFTIFCVIATTSCTAFADAPAANGEVADRSRSRSSSMSIKADSEASARKRRPEGGLRAGARPRASLTMTAQPPSRGPSTVTVVMNDRTWSQRLGSQAHAAGEPLFLPGGSQAPGGSQTVRMTQEEVLELAGLDTGDLDAMVDDMDAEDMEAEDEQSKAAEEEEEKDTPADWSEVSDFTFGGLGPSDMSTPHDAVAAAAAAPASAAAEEEENPESPPRKSPHLHGRTESVRDIRTREPTRPLARAPSARAAETSWEPDEDIFGPGVGGAPSGAQKSPTQRTATQRSATQRSATQQTSTQRTTPKPSTPVSTLSARPLPSPTQKNEVDDDEEFESDNEANPSVSVYLVRRRTLLTLQYPNLFQD